MTGLPSNFGGPGMKMSEYYNDDEEEDEEMANQVSFPYPPPTKSPQN